MKMKIVAAFAAALALMAPASAADLGPTYVDAAPNHFEGLSVGVHAGGGVASIDVLDVFDGISADGLQGGVDAEYLFGLGQRFRLGLYAQGGFANYETSIDFGPGLSGGLLNLKHYYGGGLKAGVMASRSTLIYARAGYEWQGWEAGEVFLSDPIEIDTGWWVLGGGVETMLDDSAWSLGVGVDYLMLDRADVDVPGVGDVTELLEETEQVRGLVRAAYHF